MAHPYASSRTKDRVSRMTSGYASGGAVHADAAQDRKLIRKEIAREQAMEDDTPRRARGGRVKGKTNITINVQPSPTAGSQGAVPGPIPMPPPGIMGPPPAPPPVPPRPIPLGAMGVVPPGGPGAMPMRKAGGRVADGPAWKEGLKNGTQVQHVRSNAGDHFDDNRAPAVRKAGGRIDEESTGGPMSRHRYMHMTAGAGSGDGRLEKITGQKRRG